MTLKKHTNKQTEILNLIHKYRFLNRIQIQTFLNHKNKKNINTWLNDLNEKKLIKTVGSKTIKPPENKLAVKSVTIYSRGGSKITMPFESKIVK